MKSVTIRYTLKAKSKILEERTQPELVLAEVSGAFTTKLNGKTNYSKFQFSLETHILPKYFGKIKEKRGVKNYVYDINTINDFEKYNKVLRNKINDFKSHIENAETHFKNEDPSAEAFKEHLNKITGRTQRKPVSNTLILDFLNKHIATLENIIGSGRKDAVEDGTIDTFRNLIALIKRFEEAKYNLIFEKLDENMYRDFWKTINDIRTGEIKIDSYKRKAQAAYKTSSLKSYQTYFIQLCKVGKKHGISIPLDIHDTNLINRSEDKPSEKVKAYLTEVDILDIMKYIPTTKYLKLAKDYIILASLTGMRLQSMREANGRKIEYSSKKNYPNFYYLHVKHIKTKTECYTPLFYPALNILHENNDIFPDFTKIALSNLNENIVKVINRSNIKDSNLFSSHNLRSTFVTNLALMDVDENIISYITHPRKKAASSVSIYDRRKMLDKAQTVTEAIIKANINKKSKLYTFDEAEEE